MNDDCFLSDGGARSHASDDVRFCDIALADEGFGVPGGTNDARRIIELDPDYATAKGLDTVDEGLFGKDGGIA
jgi:hypothetical protein